MLCCMHAISILVKRGVRRTFCHSGSKIDEITDDDFDKGVMIRFEDGLYIKALDERVTRIREVHAR